MKLSGKLRWMTTMSINCYHLNFHGCQSVDPSMRLPNKCLIMIMMMMIIIIIIIMMMMMIIDNIIIGQQVMVIISSITFYPFNL